MILEVTVGPLLRVEHVLETHTQCMRTNCQVCDGGLAICTVCGGFEGSLLDSCPGVRLTTEQHDWNYARWCKLSLPQLTMLGQGVGL